MCVYVCVCVCVCVCNNYLLIFICSLCMRRRLGYGRLYVCVSVYRCICMDVYMYVRVFIGVYAWKFICMCECL